MKQTLADALSQRGYDKLTQVQEAVTQPELEGVDLLVSAQTGSGKTVGFGLAIAPKLLGEEDRFGAADTPLALVIAPTRELALQVKREFEWLFAGAGAVVASCVGGMDMRDERRALARGAHIVVATPGRLRDHIMRKSINLSQLRAVVLDEADEMLDLGFREDLEFILGESPDDRQTLLFSATVPRAIGNLAKNYQTDAVRVTTSAEKSQHSDIEYSAMNVGMRDAENAIINVLRFYEAPNALVFANTRAMVNRLTTRLSNRGFSVVALSGELSQTERTHALQAMRDGRARVCVATDVAARGIDLPNLDLVVHAELPNNHETMLHRSGRTGRAGRKGVSALIVPPKSRRKAERLLQMAKVTATWCSAPSAAEVGEKDDARMLADPAWVQEITESEQPRVTALTEAFSAEQLAAAYLRLYQSHHSAPEELSAVGASDKPEPRVPFGPSVWFTVAGGNDAGAEPRRLLPMLCTAGGLSKEAIGAIRIQQTQSFVEIREADVAGFLAKVGSGMKIEGAALARLDKAPEFAARGPRPPHKGAGAAKSGGKPKYEKAKRSAYDQRKLDTYAAGAKTSDGEAAESKRDAIPAPKAKSHGTTQKVDWDDAPAPRVKKPKPGGKPGAKSTGKPRAKSHGATEPRPEGVVTPIKPKRSGTDSPHSKSGEKKPRWKASSKPSARGTGKAPAVGKPNSKKNKARRAATSGSKGGNTPPKRG